MRHLPSAGDLWGGLSGMLVALPQSIAFGITVFSAIDPAMLTQGAMAGIVGAVAIGIIAPVFGGTPRLISSPCAPAAAFLAGLTSEAWMGSLRIGAGDAVIVALLILVIVSAGLIQVLFSLLGGGKVIKYIPFPVVEGYMSSVGIIIAIGQLQRLLGTPDFFHSHTLTESQAHGLIVAAVTIAAMVLLPRLTTIVPAPIFGLGAGLAAFGVLAALFAQYRTLEGNPMVVGSLRVDLSESSVLSRFASIRSLDAGSLKEALIAGATLAVILSIDTLKSCVVVDTVTHSRSDSNRELLGQGLGNIVSGLAGGMAGAGTLGATLVNVSSGGATRISGALAGSFSLAALLFLAPFFAWVPVPALAGILIVAGARMIDWRLLNLLRRRATILDFFVIVTVILAALRFSLMAAAGAGVALSALFFLREQMRGSVVHKRSLGSEISSKRSRLPEEQRVIATKGAQTVLYELQGSLFFGNTDRLFQLINQDLALARFVILSMRRVQSMDSTAVHTLQQISALLSESGGRLLLSDLPEGKSPGLPTETYLRDAGLLGQGSSIIVFEEFYYALEWTEDFLLQEENLYHSHREEPLSLEKIEVFREMPPDRIEAIRSCLEPLSFRAGETIFQAGDTTDSVFFLRRGIVKILLRINSHRSRHLASFGRGDFFGDMAFVDHEVRSADAIAETDCDVFSLSRSRFDELVNQDPALGGKFYENLVRVLAHRFRALHRELRALD